MIVDADYANGTVIVHIAPAHGEEDYRSGHEHALDFINVVDSAGK